LSVAAAGIPLKKIGFTPDKAIDIAKTVYEIEAITSLKTTTIVQITHHNRRTTLPG